jgi:hypothetical protein
MEFFWVFDYGTWIKFTPKQNDPSKKNGMCMVRKNFMVMKLNHLYIQH